MDPNALMHTVWDLLDSVEAEQPVEVEDLAYEVRTLLEWLGKGGAHPDRWQR